MMDSLSWTRELGQMIKKNERMYKDSLQISILISSQALANCLNDIDAIEVHTVDIVHDYLRLCTNDGDIGVPCETNRTGSFVQDNVRWDWIRQLCNEISEQPLTLWITNNRVNIPFTYE